MPAWSPLVHVMARAAEKAGRGLRRDFGEVEHLQVSRKGPGDFVTTADLNAQKTIHEELARGRPEFGFLMEEGGNVDGRAWRWIVDPLDGTANFMHALPFWCITIAVQHNDEIVAGIVYEPLTDEIYWAEKGTGAFCRHGRLRVSSRTNPEDCAIVPPPFLIHGPVLAPRLAALGFQHVRYIGSTALELAYVAAGRLDACLCDGGIKPWDVAAGMLMVKEAGGMISSVHADRSPLDGGGIIATNGHLHPTMTGLLRAA